MTRMHPHLIGQGEQFGLDGVDELGVVTARQVGAAYASEERIKELTKAMIRCIPLHNVLEDGVCVLTGAPSKQRVLFARAY